MRIRHPHIYENKTTINVIENIAKKTYMITRQQHMLFLCLSIAKKIASLYIQHTPNSMQHHANEEAQNPHNNVSRG